MIGARVKLGIYNLFLVLAAPFLLGKKAIKFGRRGHKHEWDPARWSAPQKTEGDKPRVVFVALSWGEIRVLNEISQRLQPLFPDFQIIWSIREKSAQEMARNDFPGRDVVPMPFDFAIPTQQWLDAVRPDVLVVVEKFWWPNLVWGARLRGAKVVLVNGRSRGRERARYKLLGAFQKWVMGAFDLLLFESEAQVERVRPVLPREAKVEATGNVKFAFEAPKVPTDAARLQQWLHSLGKTLLFAGSTSPIDEKWALDAFEEIRGELSCVLVIAPRRVDRADEVAEQIEARGLRVSRRSAPQEGADILLLDTLGELAHAYQFGVAAYVGGSVEGRGHNIIEPLFWGIPVGYGPVRGDFESAQRAAEEWEVGFRLKNPGELTDFWQRALRDATFREETAKKSKKLMAAQRGALDTAISAIQKLLAEQAR